MHCDFCFDTDIAWEYPCEDFVLQDIGAGSIGPWMACKPCHQVIEDDDTDKLVQRIVHGVRAIPLYEDEATKYAARIVSLFKKHRTGPPTTVEE